MDAAAAANGSEAHIRAKKGELEIEAHVIGQHLGNGTGFTPLSGPNPKLGVVEIHHASQGAALFVHRQKLLKEVRLTKREKIKKMKRAAKRAKVGKSSPQVKPLAFETVGAVTGSHLRVCGKSSTTKGAAKLAAKAAKLAAN